jgi:hypothetical protein
VSYERELEDDVLAGFAVRNLDDFFEVVEPRDFGHGVNGRWFSALRTLHHRGMLRREVVVRVDGRPVTIETAVADEHGRQAAVVAIEVPHFGAVVKDLGAPDPVGERRRFTEMLRSACPATSRGVERFLERAQARRVAIAASEAARLLAAGHGLDDAEVQRLVDQVSAGARRPVGAPA